MGHEHDINEADERATASRRHLLRWAAAGAGAAAVVTVAAGTPAHAATGSPAVTGATNNNGTTQTGFVHNGADQNGPALNAYRTTANTTGVQYGENAGLIAETTIKDNDGVIGFCAGGPMSSGVHGFSFDGRGVVGSGDQGVGVLGEIRTGNSSENSIAVQADNESTGAGAIGVKATATTSTAGLGASLAGSLAPLLLVPADTNGAPKTGAHTAGELYVDAKGDLYYCRAAGTPGTWVNLLAAPAATAASLHPVSPARVYDSREAQPDPGAIGTGETRTISVADGRAISGGAVTVPNLVPAGATAVAYNFTVTNTVGAGFLTVNPGGNTTVTSSAINWSASGQILTTGSLVSINANREVTVIAGGPGATDFLLDVVGYYL